MTTTHPKRRFFRYSLRTMLVLVVVTVFCVWMAIATKRARDQRQAVDAILELGGTVRYEHERGGVFTGEPVPLPISEPPGPAWLRRLIGNEYFFSVYTVILVDAMADDTTLAAIEQFTDLKVLGLTRSQYTNATLEHLKDLEKLKTLRLDTTPTNDAGLVHFKRLTNLQWLCLNDTQVTDVGLVNLKGLANLRNLDLNDTQVTDAGLEHLKGLTTLKSLQVYNTQVTDEGIKKLQRALPKCNILH